MQALAIKGGRPLHGSVDVPGSKNSALSLLSAVILAEGETVLHNVPEIADTRAKARLLQSFGAKVEWREGSLFIDPTELHAAQVDEEVARSIRTSFFLLGPLLARLGRVTLPAPGGCKIGARPVDYHLKGLSALGAEIEFRNGYFTARAERLKGADIYLDKPSPGATQHLMTSAVLAEGVTTIDNAAMEPEVASLAAFLNAMGARVEGAGTPTVTIRGVDKLHGCRFRVPSDRMQAGTFLVGGAITGGDVTVRNLLPGEQLPVVSKLREAGALVEEGHDWIRVAAPERLRAVNVLTAPFPGFPTDMQQPMTALLALARGVSTVEETVYESRIGHIQELNRMGANIMLQGGCVSIIQGVERLQGAVVEASDLRAGAALVVAGLAAEGETTIRKIGHIDRGYEKLEATLRSLGASIERIELGDSQSAVTSDPHL
ncbi:UDP-N-acetylglucosamine 1-carboxyvinyltransferase [bacterium]|nr:MAG: UDP-N-acetylglucosamine 1-carboxyvinyltransferase [bacterium]